MFSESVCGPICQHPACWKAKHTPPRSASPDFIASLKRPEPELPTLSINPLEPDSFQRHKALPPIRDHGTGHGYIKPMYSEMKMNEAPVPRVSHIIVQAGFQCYTQKRWIWLPSLHNDRPSIAKGHPKAHIKDLTNDMLPSRPGTTRHARASHTRTMNARPRGHSYLDLVKKLGHLNLLDLPHYLQVKMLENVQLRRLLTTHPIDHIPAGIVPESALLDLMRYQMSPQLPTNPALEGVGIFFDPPDDMASKQEPKQLIMPQRRCAGDPEPSTYVPTMRREIEPSDLPLPEVRPAGRPDFREYVMSKRSSTGSPVIDLPQVDDLKSTTTAGIETSKCSSSRATTEKPEEGSTQAEEEIEEEEEEEDRKIEVTQSLDIVLPADEHGIRIPSAIEEGDDLELMAITGSLPPTRDSWRHTSFSTVTPISATLPHEKTLAMTPPLETKTASCDPSVEGGRSEAASPSLIPAPTCTPTNELLDQEGGGETPGVVSPPGRTDEGVSSDQPAYSELSPTGDTSPSKSGDLSPTKSGDVSPTKSGDLSPTKSGDVSPSKGGDVSPGKSGDESVVVTPQGDEADTHITPAVEGDIQLSPEETTPLSEPAAQPTTEGETPPSVLEAKTPEEAEIEERES